MEWKGFMPSLFLFSPGCEKRSYDSLQAFCEKYLFQAAARQSTLNFIWRFTSLNKMKAAFGLPFLCRKAWERCNMATAKQWSLLLQHLVLNIKTEVVLCFCFIIPSSVPQFLHLYPNSLTIERSSGFLWGLKNKYNHYCLCDHRITIKSPGSAIYTVILNPILLLKLSAIYYFCNAKHHRSQRLQTQSGIAPTYSCGHLRLTTRAKPPPRITAITPDCSLPSPCQKEML